MGLTEFTLHCAVLSNKQTQQKLCLVLCCICNCICMCICICNCICICTSITALHQWELWLLQCLDLASALYLYLYLYYHLHLYLFTKLHQWKFWLLQCGCEEASLRLSRLGLSSQFLKYQRMQQLLSAAFFHAFSVSSFSVKTTQLLSLKIWWVWQLWEAQLWGQSRITAAFTA